MASTPNPQNLYQACRSADRAACADAYQQLGEFLLRVALSRLHTKPELSPHAQECAQEALVTIWQKLEAGHGPDHPSQFLSWSAAIVVHKVYDELRRLGYGLGSREPDPAESTGPAPAAGRTRRVPKQQQESLEQLIDGEDGSAIPWVERVFDPLAIDPEANVVEREEVVQLLRGIRNHPRLSDSSKEVLMHGFLAGLTDDELATRLDISKSNVHVIRSRNLSKLRDDADFMSQLESHFG
jgi:RNA polymerase sigma factor (sigma-70 family)